MNGIGNDFHPSQIEDDIYDLCDETGEYIASSREYERTVGPAIMNYLENCGVQFNMIADPLTVKEIRSAFEKSIKALNKGAGFVSLTNFLEDEDEEDEEA